MTAQRPLGFTIIAALLIIYAIVGITLIFLIKSGNPALLTTFSVYVGVVQAAIYVIVAALLLTARKREAKIAMIFLLLDIIVAAALQVTVYAPPFQRFPSNSLIFGIAGAIVIIIFIVYIKLNLKRLS